LLVAAAVLSPVRSPAPLMYVPGEGWYYEPFGENAHWQRSRAKDQLQVAEDAFTAKSYSVTIRAASRVLRVWPLSDYAARAAYLLGRCQEVDGKDEAAFNSYQKIIEKYPKSAEYNEVLWRQFGIASRFLDGEWFKLWNTIPLYTSMDETAKLFEKVVANGPHSEVAPHAQLKVGAAREKQKNYEDAVKAYDLAADRYHDQPKISADAMYRSAVSWEKQADTAEYDQSSAAQAIAAYTDFTVVFPDDPRAADAQKAMVKLKAEQVRGSFTIAQFYEQSHKWAGAIVYYNDVLQLDANSPLAEQSRQRIEILKPRLPSAPQK